MATLGFAAVSSASPAGGAQQATTSRPDIVSAAVTDQPSVSNLTGTPTIKACFDQQIASPVAAQFRATGADVLGAGNPLSPSAATSIPSELNCVSLTFAGGSNVAGFSTLEVLSGAVSPAGGGAGTNPQGAAAITGGDIVPGAGKIAAPNLTGASVADLAGGTEVTYTFDTMINPTGILPANFGYYNTGGAAVPATSVITVSDRAVKVKFVTAVSATSRVFVSNDAVRLAGQLDRGNAATATSGAGGLPPASSAPDIAKITRVAGLQATYDVTYSQNITSNDTMAVNCQADTPAGRFPGTTGAVQNATTVRVTFGTLAASSRADEEVVRITDNGGCATSNAGALASTVGAAPVQNKDHTPGFTSGPDLSGCAAPSGGTDVTYTFDELIAPGAVPGSAFGLIDANGDRSSGTGAVLQVVDNKVTVRFAVVGLLSSAMGCTVDRNAVFDRQPGGAEPNPTNTVKANSVGTPENTKAPVTGPLPPTTTTPPARPPFVKRAVRTISATPSCRSVGNGKVRCTTKGTVRLATALAPLGKKNICTGTVRVRYTSGKKTIATRTARLGTKCTYRNTATFKLSRRSRAGLRVQSKYNGSLVSKTKSSRKVKARIR
ncbi:MAG: hypothetical protein QOG42_881 [Solirubrobacteraceae bacterium]|nr:hypothetical protein [Solirubrobacteraceae bacterium]